MRCSLMFVFFTSVEIHFAFEIVIGTMECKSLAVKRNTYIDITQRDIMQCFTIYQLLYWLFLCISYPSDGGHI